jgi:hypothetical protein
MIKKNQRSHNQFQLEKGRKKGTPLNTQTGETKVTSPNSQIKSLTLQSLIT